MRDLSVQAASGGLSTTEQAYLDTEQSKLASALDSAIDQAKFGNTDLVSGTAARLLLCSQALMPRTAQISSSTHSLPILCP